MANKVKKMKYCTIGDVIRDYSVRPIAVLTDEGTDFLLQENGYTIEDALVFAGKGYRFFYDKGEINKI